MHHITIKVSNMWTRSDWRHLTLSPRPTINSFSVFLFSLFIGLSFYTLNWFFLTGSFLTIVCYFLFPKILFALNNVWFLFGQSLSWLVQPVFLLIIYLLIFAPFGLLLKLFRQEKNNGHWVTKDRPCRFDKTF